MKHRHLWLMSDLDMGSFRVSAASSLSNRWVRLDYKHFFSMALLCLSLTLSMSTWPRLVLIHLLPNFSSLHLGLVVITKSRNVCFPMSVSVLYFRWVVKTAGLWCGCFNLLQWPRLAVCPRWTLREVVRGRVAGTALTSTAPTPPAQIVDGFV